ncbi:MAG TPA: ribbon-helix-helix domain-containing protein [Clostridiales bacterium]|nr:ribbon-helix-helix domain-containing protein [Clostridiales bacterium]
MADKKMGRPTDSPKTFMLRVKMDKDTLEKLDKCCEMEDTNRSEFVRKSIREKYGKLHKK